MPRRIEIRIALSNVLLDHPRALETTAESYPITLSNVDWRTTALWPQHRVASCDEAAFFGRTLTSRRLHGQ